MVRIKTASWKGSVYNLWLNVKSAVCLAKNTANKARFLNIKDTNKQKMKNAEKGKRQSNTVGKKFVLNDQEKLANDDAKLNTWNDHYAKLLNIEFPWVAGIFGNPPLIHITREIVETSIAKMKSNKTAHIH